MTTSIERPEVFELDLMTGDKKLRPMNDDEYEQHLADVADYAAANPDQVGE